MINSPYIEDPTRHWIAIVGMGTGGAGVFSSIVDRINMLGLSDAIGFLLIDARGESEFGRGVAWSRTQSDLFRANMRLHTIGLKNKLVKRLQAEAGLGEDEPTEDLPDEFLFQQRIKIGDVLHDDFVEYLALAKSQGIPCRLVASNVQDISRKGRAYVVETTDGQSLYADTVILALGNFPKNAMPNLRGRPGYFHNPWLWNDYKDQVAGKRVGVVGLGPTAVDTILLAGQSGAAQIFATSRGGRIQYPRPKNEPYALTHMSENRLREIIAMRKSRGEPGLSYQTLTTLLMSEFDEVKACTGWNKALRNWRKPAHEALNLGLADCKKEAKWYSILKALDPITPFIWNELDSVAREDYKNTDREGHTNLSYGMASPQARRLTEYLDSHKLFIQGQFLKALERPTGGFELVYGSRNDDGGETETGRQIVDLVINCSGIGSDIKSSTSELIGNLLSKGWICDHDDGGIFVDFTSGKVVDKSGMPRGEIYCLAGSLTFGTHLLTNCISQVWESAERTGLAIVSQLSTSLPRG